MKRFSTLFGFALIVVLVIGVIAAPAAYTRADESKARVLVQFVPGQKAIVQNTLRGVGGQTHFEFDNLDTIAVTVPESALFGLSHNPNIVMIEEDSLRYPVGINLSAYQAEAQAVPYGIDMVQARDVWDENRDGEIDAGAPTGDNRTVCIIDSGLYVGHEDLAGISAIGYDNSSLPWDVDHDGHGSHVAGTISAMNNTLGVVGVTPGTVNLYIVRVFGDDGLWAYSSTLIDAANRCEDAGANIISMSLGGDRSNNTERRGFDTLYANGILPIAAAGNDGTTGYSYPGSYDSVVSVAAIDSEKLVADFSQKNDQVELAAPGVNVLSTVPYIDASSLTVNGLTYAANHIEFSARGTANGALVDGGLCLTTGAWSGQVVLCERGDISFYDKVMNVQNSGGAAAILYNNEPGNFHGTLGDEASSSTIIGLSLSQEDGQTLVAGSLGQTGVVESIFTDQVNGYAYYDGTSMATPHVAAVAALVWSADITATNVEIRDILVTTAEDLGDVGRDASYGFGLVQSFDAVEVLTGGGGDDNPPVANITSPVDSAVFTSGESISFTGSASDVEDGDLTSNLTWTSNLDGQIGTGGSFSYMLSDGTHTITAEVTDSYGNTSSDSITVIVGGGGGEDTAMHVAALDGTSIVVNRRFWQASVDVQVVDLTGTAVANVTVSGDWSGSYAGSVSCVTDVTGWCTVLTARNKVTAPVAFTVTDLEAAGYFYDAAANVLSAVTVVNP